MTEEKGNTKEVRFSIYNTDWADLVHDAIEELITDCDVFSLDKVENKGYFQVTVVYRQEVGSE